MNYYLSFNGLLVGISFIRRFVIDRYFWSFWSFESFRYCWGFLVIFLFLGVFIFVFVSILLVSFFFVLFLGPY